MKHELARPFYPFDHASGSESFAVAEFIKSLRNEEAYAKDGRTALALARSDRLTVVLTVIRKGARLKEHRAPGPATVTVLDGKVKMEIDGASEELGPLQTTVMAASLSHAVEAVEDAAILIVIGGRDE